MLAKIGRQGQLRHRAPRRRLRRRGAQSATGSNRRSRSSASARASPSPTATWWRRTADRARERDLRARRQERMSARAWCSAPGLWMPGAAMALLARAAARARGYAVHVFAYRGRASVRSQRRGAGALRQAARPRLRRPQPGRRADPRHAQPPSRDRGRRPRVLLGAPVRGCLAGRRFGARAARPLDDGRLPRAVGGARRRAGRARAPLGVVAGTAAARPRPRVRRACRARTTAWCASRRPRSTA